MSQLVVSGIILLSVAVVTIFAEWLIDIWYNSVDRRSTVDDE